MALISSGLLPAPALGQLLITVFFGCSLLSAENEIPIDHCDRLPVVTVQVDGNPMRFLVDTGATTFLNSKSFAGGGTQPVEITSWTGNTLTSARQVAVRKLTLGSRTLHQLRLPAIDLSPIAKACGGSIDGILGVDLLEELGAVLNLKKHIATIETDNEDGGQEALLKGFRLNHARCLSAFNRGDEAILRDCLDPEVIFFTAGREAWGRAEVLDYLRNRYFKLAPRPILNVEVKDYRLLGEAVWYTYDLSIDHPEVGLRARGMAVCRKGPSGWQLLNMHNSTK